VHPEQIRGFADLASHLWVVQVATEVLGPDYEIVELGFDIPFAGDGPALAPRLPDTRHDPDRAPADLAGHQRHHSGHGRGLGPFEIAPGTQWDDSPEFDHEMFLRR